MKQSRIIVHVDFVADESLARNERIECEREMREIDEILVGYGRAPKFASTMDSFWKRSNMVTLTRAENKRKVEDISVLSTLGGQHFFHE